MLIHFDLLFAHSTDISVTEADSMCCCKCYFPMFSSTQTQLCLPPLCCCGDRTTICMSRYHQRISAKMCLFLWNRYYSGNDSIKINIAPQQLQQKFFNCMSECRITCITVAISGLSHPDLSLSVPVEVLTLTLFLISGNNQSHNPPSSPWKPPPTLAPPSLLLPRPQASWEPPISTQRPIRLLTRTDTLAMKIFFFS